MRRENLVRAIQEIRMDTSFSTIRSVDILLEIFSEYDKKIEKLEEEVKRLNLVKQARI